MAGTNNPFVARNGLQTAGTLNVGSNATFAQYVLVGNSTVNVSINSTFYTGLSNTALVSNNSTNFGGQLPAYYQTAGGLASNVATMTANNSTYFGGQLPAYYANVTAPNFSTSVTVGNSTINVFSNSSSITVGNTVMDRVHFAAGNTTINSTAIVIGNVTINSVAVSISGAILGGSLVGVASNVALAAGSTYRLVGGSNVVMTLPASPANNDTIRIYDSGGIKATGKPVVARNGNTIMAKSQDMTLDIAGIDFVLWWNGTDWRLA